MKILNGVLPWTYGGILLAIAFLMAVVLVKPIGVSTQFVIIDGLAWHMVNPDLIIPDETAKHGFTSSNAYLNKSGGKYAANIIQPLNYGLVFVLAMMAGAFISSRLKGDIPHTPQDKAMPDIWRRRFGPDARYRYLSCFAAGILVLFGARLAGGCTSGHMMSGMMQTALSGYLFAIGVFATAIPLAIITFRKGA